MNLYPYRTPAPPTRPAPDSNDERVCSMLLLFVGLLGLLSSAASPEPLGGQFTAATTMLVVGAWSLRPKQKPGIYQYNENEGG